MLLWTLGYIYHFHFIFISSRYIPKSGITGSHGSFSFSLRCLPTVFRSGRTSLHSYQQCYEGSPFSISPTFIICSLFDNSHPDQCEVIAHCSFGSHFSNVAFLLLSIFSCWPSVCLLWKISILGLSFCLSLDVELYELCILDINLLLVASFANIFSHSIGHLSLFSMVSFAVQKFLNLIRFHLFIFAFISFTLKPDLRKHCYDLCFA